MNKKITAGILLLLISTITPSCKHEKVSSSALYLNYLKSRIKA